MKHAKKIVVPSRLNRVDPVSHKLNELEIEINKILANKQMSMDEKASLYQQLLSNYLEFHRQKSANGKSSHSKELKNIQEEIKDTQKELKKSQSDLQNLYQKNTQDLEKLKNDSIKYDYPDEVIESDDEYFKDAYNYDENDYDDDFKAAVKNYYDSKQKQNASMHEKFNSKKANFSNTFNNTINKGMPRSKSIYDYNIPPSTSMQSFRSLKKNNGSNMKL
jgi:hypothetical protein